MAGELAIAFELPFKVSLSSLPPGGPVLVTKLSFANALSDEEREAVTGSFTSFFEAASLGMLAGGSTRPVLLEGSAQELEQYLRFSFASPSSVQCELFRVPLDVRAATILINRLLCFHEVKAPLRAVDIALAVRPGLTLTLGHGKRTSYPEAFQPLPFTYENKASGSSGAVTLVMLFQRPCRDEELTTLRSAFETWTLLCAQGSYISPPYSPQGDYFLAPTEELEVLDEEVLWRIQQFRIDEESIAAIVNYLVAFHEKYNRLLEVRVA